MIPAVQESAGYYHRRSSCDELLATAQPSSDTDSGSEYGFVATEIDGMEGQIGSTTALVEEHPAPSVKRRAIFIRTLALLASYILGPLKSRLAREIGTSHTDFGLLIAAFSLNSTWTPLIGGLLASRLGTTLTSILATGVIFVGQFLLLLGDIWEDVRLMVLGLFIFGLGVSPLAVVQETIIVRFFKSHGLGVSMAFGLIAGKGASFIAARTSYPLTESFGPRAPFYVATLLAALSVVINLVYIAASKWLIDGAGAELEATDIATEAQTRLVDNVSEAQALKKVAEKRKVKFREVIKLGDVFWAYIGLNVLSGMMWSPFTHLAANIIETRYNLSERDAATRASYLLAGSLILYPTLEQTGSTIFQTLAGLVLDMQKKTDHKASKAALQHFLNVFVAVNGVQLSSVLGLAALQKKKAQAAIQKRSHSSNEETQGLMSGSEVQTSYMSSGCRNRESSIGRSEIRRGVMFALLSAILVFIAWFLFLATAWFRLGREQGNT
ncbi:hypothetical protein C0995_010042 [Termitomyces sp. Mi166|nr:hypothetical protein C0995_010042 [Termitomyces sp. Mi166\